MPAGRSSALRSSLALDEGEGVMVMAMKMIGGNGVLLARLQWIGRVVASDDWWE